MTNSGAGSSRRPGGLLSVICRPPRDIPEVAGLELLFAFELGRNRVRFAPRRILPDPHAVGRRAPGVPAVAMKAGYLLRVSRPADNIGLRALAHGGTCTTNQGRRALVSAASRAVAAVFASRSVLHRRRFGVRLQRRHSSPRPSWQRLDARASRRNVLGDGFRTLRAGLRCTISPSLLEGDAEGLDAAVGVAAVSVAEGQTAGLVGRGGIEAVGMPGVPPLSRHSATDMTHTEKMTAATVAVMNGTRAVSFNWIS